MNRMEFINKCERIIDALSDRATFGFVKTDYDGWSLMLKGYSDAIDDIFINETEIDVILSLSEKEFKWWSEKIKLRLTRPSIDWLETHTEGRSSWIMYRTSEQDENEYIEFDSSKLSVDNLAMLAFNHFKNYDGPFIVNKNKMSVELYDSFRE